MLKILYYKRNFTSQFIYTERKYAAAHVDTHDRNTLFIWMMWQKIHRKTKHTKASVEIFTAICDTFYHLPTKLWEGNVFTAICLFMGKEFRVIIIRDALDLTVQSPLTHPPYPASDIWWPRMESCSYLFT